MTDDIRGLTARLADEPGSLAFLELAEALRQRGQLDAAAKVARGGVARYPGLADAHDLLARVLSDQGDLAGAFDAWSSALQLDPMRASALKGVAFLYFRAGDPTAALDHLHRALDVDPDDRTIGQAITRIGAGLGPDVARDARAATLPVTSPSPTPTATPAPEWPASGDRRERRAMPLFGDLDGGDGGLLLIDAGGLRLGGRFEGRDGGDAGDRVAAQLAGVAREAARATRLLGLGGWHAIAVESPDGHIVLVQPTSDSVLVATRDASLPLGRVTMLAERAARAARDWLEAHE